MIENRDEQIKCFNEEMRRIDNSNPRIYVEQYKKVLEKYKKLAKELMDEDGHLVKHTYWKVE